MTSFRATFGLTRSVRGWEKGERRERNKRKRQPGRTGAGQRRELQLNEHREEITIDVKEREENTSVASFQCSLRKAFADDKYTDGLT